MWKESLRIGIDSIDEQHKALFDKIEELRKAVQGSGDDRKQKCIDAILFLKDYTTRHFADEEAYQQSIKYKYFEAHKKLHEGFIKTLDEHEQKMKESDYAYNDVKSFTGMLMTWLLYHVSDADQKIGKEASVSTEVHSVHSDMMIFGIGDVLSKMADYDATEIREVDAYTSGSDDTLAVEVKLEGEAEGYIIYVFPFAFVKDLMNSMMGYEPEVIGELEISALFEISNIISGTMCRQISYSKKVKCDNTLPFLAEMSGTHTGEKIAVDTGRGIIETEVSIKY